MHFDQFKHAGSCKFILIATGKIIFLRVSKKSCLKYWNGMLEALYKGMVNIIQRYLIMQNLKSKNFYYKTLNNSSSQSYWFYTFKDVY